MNVLMIGNGAFAKKHLDGIQNIDGVTVAAIVGRRQSATQDIADHYGIAHAFDNLEAALAIPGLDAAIITSPTQVHAEQAIQCMRAGLHVEVEIPMADSLPDAQSICDAQKETGKIAMAGHTRRFNPSHQYVRQQIDKGEFNIQQMDVQTYFFRRTNMNAEGNPRSWTDHLLWHHACHTVDLFQYQTGEIASDVYALQGPKHPDLGIAMDMSIGLKTPSGALCTLSLSFNNNGPLGTFFRYIGDSNTYIARYDDLVDGHEKAVDVSNVAVSMNGIELQDREFFNSIAENREPNSSVHQCIDAMKTLQRLSECLDYA